MLHKILILTIIIAAIVFLPTTILLTFSMMPTIAAFTIDKTIGKSKTICVAFMNFAGCFPFLLDFWMSFSQQTIENSLAIIADSQNIIIIYLLAAGGYAIDVAVTGITSSLIIQRANSRVKSIKAKQKHLVTTWGEKVTGKYVLDEFGFPVHNIEEQRTQL